MKRGKNTCRILKEIRKKIADENDIEFVVSECTYQGDCLGTCPKCEAEVRYLERELEKRQRIGKAAVVTGLGVSTLLGLTACGNSSNNSVPDGEKASDTLIVPLSEDNNFDTVVFTDTINSQLDSITEKDKGCPARIVYDLPIPGDVIEVSSYDNSVKNADSVKDNDAGDEWIEGEAVSDDLEVFKVVEQMPEFPGGTEALKSYLEKNVHYPKETIDMCVMGYVFVSFIVEVDGSISNAKVEKGLDHGFDEEALRVVNAMPKWKPGKQRGKPVRVLYNLPISSKL